MNRTVYRGIGKLIEECGEVMQLAGKAIAFPIGEHPDGKGDLRQRLLVECADLYAALDYFCEENDIPANMSQRRQDKYDQFRRWELSGIEVNP
jgi:hypothetical protein